MSDSVLNKYLAPSNGDEDFEYNDDDEHMPSPPRTPNPYRPLDDNMDPSIESENESPPASQPEPRHKTASYAKDTFKENERQSPPKSPVRDYLTTEPVPPKTRKRKHSYDTIASFEFKRQKTEESILKLESLYLLKQEKENTATIRSHHLNSKDRKQRNPSSNWRNT